LKLSIENIAKKYNNQWLFKDINFELNSGESLSILGKNGSGKSTLIQVIYGLIQPSKGLIRLDNEIQFEPSKYFAFTSPYLELPMEFTIKEIHKLYVSMNKSEVTLHHLMDFAYFEKNKADLPLKYFSSGMLQRLKTALCLLSDVEIYLLDEPLTNMDAIGEKWYSENLDTVRNKICIVASNQEAEYAWTTSSITIGNSI
jgi:ABC-type multidrug transport system ATPase subunit